MKKECEIWKSVVGYEGHYEVSSFGRVRSLDRYEKWPRFSGIRPRKGKNIKPSPNQDGYPQLTLSKHSKTRTVVVHVLVLEAFVGPRPKRHFGCHKNDVKTDNVIDNLYWALPKKNTDDARKNGKLNVGESRRNSKLTDDIVTYMITNYKPKSKEFGIRAFSKRFGVAYSTIENVIYKHTWKHITYYSAKN